MYTNTKKTKYLNVFWELLKTDMYIYKSAVASACIDVIPWFISIIGVFVYVFPLVGLSQNFSIFMAIGAVVSCIFWDIWSTATGFISDIEDNKTINYFLTLPLPNTLILIKQIISYAIKAGLPSLLILPLTKLLLWNIVSFSNFSIIKFVITIILTSIFIGAFSLFIISRIKNIHHIGKVGIRFLFPLWTFGGSNYSFKMIHKISPIFAYFTLLNPLLYPMESIRIAVLGQTGFIPFYICIIMQILFTILFGFLGIKSLKKRLDFV